MTIPDAESDDEARASPEVVEETKNANDLEQDDDSKASGAVEEEEEGNERPTQDEHDDPADEQINSNKKRPVFRLNLNDTTDYNAKLAKRGVIYLPSVPKSMNPTILRQLLEPHGDITRLYLKPSDSKKSSRKRYVEGWVEFSKKSTAKRIASALHQTAITNQKRSLMYGDLWSMKYLKGGFKWDHLTETMAYERRVREQKIRLEDMQARKEANVYKTLLEKNETMDYIRERRQGSKTEGSSPKSGSKKRNRKSKQPLNEQGAERATKKVLLESLL